MLNDSDEFESFKEIYSGQSKVKKENHINTDDCLQMLVLKLDAIGFPWVFMTKSFFPIVRCGFFCENRQRLQTVKISKHTFKKITCYNWDT